MSDELFVEYGVMIDEEGSIDTLSDAENAIAHAKEFGGIPVEVIVRALPHGHPRKGTSSPLRIDRVSTPEELEALPAGTIYLSDGYGLAEYKRGTGWFALESDERFEPDLPGTAFFVGRETA